MEPRYVSETSRRGVAIRLFTAFMLGGILLGLLLIVFESAGGGLSLVLGCAALIVITLVILPKRLEVWPERLAIVFPLGVWNLPFDSVEGVREARSYEPYAFAGVRFATDPSRSVVVLRKNARMVGRPNIVLSPRDRERFLIEMRLALRGSEPGSGASNGR